MRHIEAVVFDMDIYWHVLAKLGVKPENAVGVEYSGGLTHLTTAGECQHLPVRVGKLALSANRHEWPVPAVKWATESWPSPVSVQGCWSDGRLGDFPDAANGRLS